MEWVRERGSGGRSFKQWKRSLNFAFDYLQLTDVLAVEARRAKEPVAENVRVGAAEFARDVIHCWEFSQPEYLGIYT